MADDAVESGPSAVADKPADAPGPPTHANNQEPAAEDKAEQQKQAQAEMGRMLPEKYMSLDRSEGLERVENLRDVAAMSDGRMKPGLVFRSACPSDASTSDVEYLLGRIRICELVDLRVPMELQEDTKTKSMELYKGFTTYYYARGKAYTAPPEEPLPVPEPEAAPTASKEAQKDEHQPEAHGDEEQQNGAAVTAGPRVGSESGSDSETEAEAAEAETEAERQAEAEAEAEGVKTAEAATAVASAEVKRGRHCVSLLRTRAYGVGVLKRMGALRTAYTLLWYPLSPAYAADMAIASVNRGGLAMMYEVILDTAKAEVCAVLRVITVAASRNRPVLFFCKAGKDRTGLVAMLVLACCGASDEEILMDYTLSNAADVAFNMHGPHGAAPPVRGLDTTAFVGAPEHVMRRTLAYVRKKYGSLEKYLDACRFDEVWRRRLRHTLLARPLDDTDLANQALTRGPDPTPPKAGTKVAPATEPLLEAAAETPSSPSSVDPVGKIAELLTDVQVAELPGGAEDGQDAQKEQQSGEGQGVVKQE
eukprot:jgi/Chlat1/1138/Chrsp112S01618